MVVHNNNLLPIINGDGSFSRDFTYIDNVIQMNELAILSKNEEAINTVYNTAFSDKSIIDNRAWAKPI